MAQLTTFLGRHANKRGLTLSTKLLPALDTLRTRILGLFAAQPETTAALVARIGASRCRRQKRGQAGNENGTETSVHARYRRPNS
jgi:hypothetical protein